MAAADIPVFTDADFSFRDFQELMAKKIIKILLISSPYDAFIMEEDGGLAERINYEFRGLNLTRPPMLKWASTGEEALRALSARKYNLVIVMPRLEDMDPYALCHEIKRRYRRLPVYFLAHDMGALMRDAGNRDRSVFDRTFVWRGDTDLLLALVKSTEDRMNVAHDTRRAGVRVMIFVEDSPFYRSALLPYLYKEIVMQTQAIMDESLNETQRMLRMRARPKILIAEDFEEAEDLFRRFRKYLMGVFSDVRFPRNGRMDDQAGFALLRMIKRECPGLPVMMLSSEEANREPAERIPAVFLNKNSPAFHADMRFFFMSYLGFGDFVFRQPDGTVVARASNLRTLESILHSVPDDAIAYHAGRNDFSTWLVARFEIQLASELRQAILTHCADAREIREYLIHALRRKIDIQKSGIIADFNYHNFYPDSDFIKIGRGSLGGKARGLAFISTLLKKKAWFHERFPDIRIAIPRTLVITTEGFDAFVQENDLTDYSVEDRTDAEIISDFLEFRIPGWLRRNLELFLAQVGYPLAVRSSSILEDTYARPCAGVYDTFMIPNNHPDAAVRLDQLVRSIKKVYASTFLEGPQRIAAGTLYRTEDDKMAVIIQALSGRQYGDYFYPAVSGVAQSYNFYPVSNMKPEEGIAFIAFGFGKTVVEGGTSLRFSPRYPESLPQFSTVEDTLKYTQQFFYALKLNGETSPDSSAEEMLLQRLAIEDVVDHDTVQRLAGFYDSDDDRIKDTFFQGGYPVMTFVSLLKYKMLPLPEIIVELLETGRRGMGCPVEIEFAVNLPTPERRQAEFSVLQIRPMVTCRHAVEIEITDQDIRRAFCYSTRAMGNSQERKIRDVVYVRPETFDPGRTVQMADEIGRLNAILGKKSRKYLLAGPGRWGSQDPWLGIPVKWNDISAVSSMIEAATEKLRADPSQGTHFFHNITSLEISYLTIQQDDEDILDWQWLDAQPAETEMDFVRHVHFPSPMTLKINGKMSTAVIVKNRDENQGAETKTKGQA